MNSKIITFGLIAVLLLSGTVDMACAGDWPMFHHDVAHSGYAPDEKVPDDLELLWSYETRGEVLSSPAVADGKVYVGSRDGVLYCLDENTGSVIWNYNTWSRIYFSSPVVENGRVLISSGKTHCLNKTSGTEIWSYESGSPDSSPAVANTKVFVSSVNPYNAVYCIDTNSGKLIWRWNGTPPQYVAENESRIYPLFSPTAVDGKVFVGSSDGNFYCLNENTGELIWSCKMGCVEKPPTVLGSKVIVGSNDAKIYCLNKNTGELIWSYETGGSVDSSPAVTDGKVFASSWNGNIYCLDEDTGKLIWRYKTGDNIKSSPAVADGKVFVGSDDNKIYCLNETNGELIWNYETGDKVRSSPAIANGKVFVGSDDGKIYCFGKREPIIQIIDIIETENSLEQEILGKVFNYEAPSLDVHVNGEPQKINLRNGEFDEIIKLKEGKNKIEFVIDEKVYKTINISTVKFEIPKETYSFTNSEFTEEYALTYDQFNNLLRSYLVGVSLIKANIIAPFVFVSTEKGNCYGMSSTVILYHEGMKKPVDKDVYGMNMSEAAPNIHGFQVGQVDHLLSYYVNYLLEPDEKISYNYIVESIEKEHKPVVLTTWLKVHDGLEALYDALTGKYQGHAVVAYKTYEIDGKERVVVYENKWSHPSAGCTNYALFDFSKEHAFKYTEKQLDDENIREVPYPFYPTVGPNTAINTIVDNFLRELTKLLHSNGLKLISVSCPVNVSITDESGRVIADNGTNQIENAKVIATDDVKLFFIPDELTYSVNIDAYGEGNFTLTQFSPIDSERANVTEFNSSVTPKTKASILISREKVSELKIDYDGNGTIDEEIKPVKEIIEVAIEKTTEERKGIPGFEAIFAVAGLLAVAYVLRRR